MSLLQEKLVAALGLAFGILGLILAAVGLFGLLSFFVTTRTGEIGVRLALGAERRHVCWVVVKEACLLVGTGLLIGLPLCYVGIRTLSGLVYGIPSVPIALLVLASAVLLATAGAAALIPVHRASSVDPMITLRYE